MASGKIESVEIGESLCWKKSSGIEQNPQQIIFKPGFQLLCITIILFKLCPS